MKTLLFLTGFMALSFLNVDYDKDITTYDAKEIAAVFISNINGSVTVKGLKEGSPESKHVTVSTSNNKIKNGMLLHQVMYNDTLVIVMEDKSFTAADCDNDYDFPGNIRLRDCRNYQSPQHVDINVELPPGIIVKASTINEGKISITNISEKIIADNVNGGIVLHETPNIEKAHTINGDLDIRINQQPQINGAFYSLNGDINMKVIEGLNAELTFKSFNGDFYTDIKDIEVKESKIEKINKSRGFHIKADQKSYMVAGKGGVTLDLETFNGDAILKSKDI